jgi:alkanesulfonate monooxygenase SsuD/methylene tetrahydromethanopterin reductase-like flavin-dependent oxidoreductase (luciferase family)
VRVGAFSVVESRAGVATDPVGTRYDELLRLVETAERSGLASFWVAEHHFQSSGLCPSPPVLLAAAGQRTASIRLGSLVCVLPFHRPIDVAEEYSLLDILLHGRLNLGVGSGYIPLELEGFGIPAERKREWFDRNLASVRVALQGGPIRTDGGPEVRLNVRSPQHPHPPIWVAAQRRESVVHIARAGLSLALLPYATFHDAADLGDAVKEYRRAMAPGTRGNVSVALPIYVGDDPARATRALDRHLKTRSATREGFYEGSVRRGPSRISAQDVERAGFSVFGSADAVAQRLEEFERIGVDEVLGMFDLGDLPMAEAAQSVRRVGALWSSGSAAIPMASMVSLTARF